MIFTSIGKNSGISRWLLYLLPFALSAYEGYIESAAPLKPWFTGPLITTSGNITPKGHWNIEPYFFATATTGYYKNDWSSKSEPTLWSLQWRLPTYVGLARWLDVQFVPIWNWKYRENSAQWSLGDMRLQFDVQIYRNPLPHKNWIPSIKLIIRESIPTGKYRNLDLKKKGADAGGNGTWLTSIHLAISRIFPLSGDHFFDARFNFQYGIPSPVHVKGVNAYGGGLGTNGTIYPERTCLTSVGFQYNFTRNWVLAFDAAGQFNSKTRFSGNPGIDQSASADISASALPAINEREASVQYSLAPALEYNWSEKLGLIAGCWLSIAGKNSRKFTSGIIALNYSD
jgi:hypothetical protein